jgi:hypothetical protein
MGVGVRAVWSISAVSTYCVAGDAYLCWRAVEMDLAATVLCARVAPRGMTRGTAHAEQREGARDRSVLVRDAMVASS